MKRLFVLALLLPLVFGGIGFFAGSHLPQDNAIPPVQPTTQASTSSPTSAKNGSKGQQASVVKVVDGDTLTVSLNGRSETIRIIGINSPETVDPRKQVECFGQKASERAKELLTNQDVQLEADPTQGERDKYSRLLRFVWLENGTVDFGALMIEQGFAYEYTYNTPYKYQAKYKTLQKEAENVKKGLWADDACVVTSTEDKDCSDFITHQEAQNYFVSKGGSPTNNADKLDSDGDGIACESLP